MWATEPGRTVTAELISGAGGVVHTEEVVAHLNVAESGQRVLDVSLVTVAPEVCGIKGLQQ